MSTEAQKDQDQWNMFVYSFGIVTGRLSRDDTLQFFEDKGIDSEDLLLLQALCHKVAKAFYR